MAQVPVPACTKFKGNNKLQVSLAKLGAGNPPVSLNSEKVLALNPT